MVQTIKNITKAKHDFEGLFNPSALEWREKTIHDADQAFEAILKVEVSTRYFASIRYIYSGKLTGFRQTSQFLQSGVNVIPSFIAFVTSL